MQTKSPKTVIWENVRWTLVAEKGPEPFHCTGCDSDVAGLRAVYKSDDGDAVWCEDCVATVLAEGAHSSDPEPPEPAPGEGDNCARCGNPIDHAEPHTYCDACA